MCGNELLQTMHLLLIAFSKYESALPIPHDLYVKKRKEKKKENQAC